jgi:hypothetical protein
MVWLALDYSIYLYNKDDKKDEYDRYVLIGGTNFYQKGHTGVGLCPYCVAAASD